MAFTTQEIESHEKVCSPGRVGNRDAEVTEFDDVLTRKEDV